jgi:RNA polymerase sigma-70 factor (ECF subfamily)
MDWPEARRTSGLNPGHPRVAGPSVDITEAVEAARGGDEDAFRLLYRTLQPGILRYLRGVVGNDAEDVASEAWANIARDIAIFSGDASGFRAWAATIARNRAMDHLRKVRRRPQPAPATSFADLDSQATADDTESRALESVATDAAVALIGSLPKDQAEAVLLRVVMGLDVATAAKVLGKRAGAVRTATHRGLRRLADQLGANDERE